MTQADIKLLSRPGIPIFCSFIETKRRYLISSEALQHALNTPAVEKIRLSIEIAVHLGHGTK